MVVTKSGGIILYGGTCDTMGNAPHNGKRKVKQHKGK